MTSSLNEPDEILAAIAREPLLGGLPIDKQKALADLVRLVGAGQGRLNLTAIRDPIAMVRYHLADSLALLPAMARNDQEQADRQAYDIGTGGGFPLLPMAIVRPDIRWTGIESVQKKAAFVQDSAIALGLTNVNLLPARAEDVGRGEQRESGSLVTARAVGPIASLLEVSVPLLAIGGRLYLFKTESARPEWGACAEVIARLGARPGREYVYTLEGDAQPRVIFAAEKISETPAEYPRRAGVPFNKPLAG